MSLTVEAQVFVALGAHVQLHHVHRLRHLLSSDRKAHERSPGQQAESQERRKRRTLFATERQCKHAKHGTIRRAAGIQHKRQRGGGHGCTPRRSKKRAS